MATGHHCADRTVGVGALDDLDRTIDGFCRERIYPFRNARRAFLLEIIFRGEVPDPPGAYFFCLSKRSRQENDPKGEAFRHCSRNDMHPPPVPLPRYSLFLHRWVALACTKLAPPIRADDIRPYDRTIEGVPTHRTIDEGCREQISSVPKRRDGVPLGSITGGVRRAARCGRPWQSSSAEKFPMLCRHHR